MVQERPSIQQKTTIKEKVNVSQKVILGVGLLFIFGILAGFAFLFSSKIGSLTNNLSKEREARKQAEQARAYSGVVISESDNDEVSCQGAMKKAHTINFSKPFPEDATTVEKEEALTDTILTATDILRSNDFKQRFPNNDPNEIIVKINTQAFKDWILGRITNQELEELDFCSGSSGCTPMGVGSCSNLCAGGSVNFRWNACFLKGTKIAIGDGYDINVEEVKSGDLVKSYDLDNQKLVTAEVARTFKSQAEEYLVINNKLRLTPSHPLFVNNAWVQAKNIKIGDGLMAENGEKVAVFSINKVQGPVDVYNLEVKDYHDYFAEGYLVHNKQWGVGPITGVSITVTIRF